MWKNFAHLSYVVVPENKTLGCWGLCELEMLMYKPDPKVGFLLWFTGPLHQAITVVGGDRYEISLILSDTVC